MARATRGVPDTAVGFRTATRLIADAISIIELLEDERYQADVDAEALGDTNARLMDKVNQLCDAAEIQSRNVASLSSERNLLMTKVKGHHSDAVAEYNRAEDLSDRLGCARVDNQRLNEQVDDLNLIIADHLRSIDVLHEENAQLRGDDLKRVEPF
jgi:hypothetical protein